MRVPAVEALVTGSFGVATMPYHAVDGASLVRAADRALYAAKASGRNRVVSATEPVAVVP
jgi:GGDEF domain-containing protein